MRILLALLLLSMSCKSAHHTEPEKALEALLGRWDATGTAITEEWSRAADGSYKAVVTSHAGATPQIQEYIEVVQEGDDWLFIGTVLNQNSGLPIRFKLKEATENRLHFENIAHDFPQSIEYFIINEEKMKARVSGTQKGEFREFIIAYYRLP